jgi:diaminopimelate decarboxylase
VHDIAYRDTSLFVEAVSLRGIAETFGTPAYIYSANSIRTHCRALEEAFDAVPHVSYYAVKANANRRLLQLIAAEGLGADVGSLGELHLAVGAGFAPSRITFSGVGKRDDEIEAGLARGILAFNVESREEIEVLNEIAGRRDARARLLLRVNLDIDAGGHAYVSTSMKQNKFGIPHTQAAELLRWAMALPNIEVRGVHSHIGSQIVKAEPFVRAARALATLVRDLRTAGIPIHDIDFGGGFGIQYHGFVTHPSLPVDEPEDPGLSSSALVRAVLPILRKTGCTISIQPGRSIVAHAGVLLVRVLYRKESGEKTFIIVDGAMNDLIRPSLYHSYHQIVPAELRGVAAETVDVVGPVCESGDFFAQDRELPVVRRGDLLAVLCAGAYGYVLASNYNARLRPPEILVDGDSCELTRPRETLDHL